VNRIGLIGHIAHASTLIPPDERKTFCISDIELRRLQLLLTDWYVDELFSGLDGCVISHSVSRIVVDPERLVDDEQEMMASRGMGAICTKTSDGSDLRLPLSSAERQDLLDRFYWPHARLMENAVKACLGQYEYPLILDCHSFSSVPLPFEPDQDVERPDICIGTDEFHTPHALIMDVEDFFQSRGFRTFRNKPYSGTYVPLPFFKKSKNVLSMMVEVNRSLYMDESTGQKSRRFDSIRRIFSELGTMLLNRKSLGMSYLR
jgi:N-formylglutamate deformylase